MLQTTVTLAARGLPVLAANYAHRVLAPRQASVQLQKRGLITELGIGLGIAGTLGTVAAWRYRVAEPDEYVVRTGPTSTCQKIRWSPFLQVWESMILLSAKKHSSGRSRHINSLKWNRETTILS